MTCYRAQGHPSVGGQTASVDLIIRKDSDDQITILSGGIAGSYVQPQTINITNISGSHPYGKDTHSDDPAIKCMNNMVGHGEFDCRCLDITAFGVDSMQTPKEIVAYGKEKCGIAGLTGAGGWTPPIHIEELSKCDASLICRMKNPTTGQRMKGVWTEHGCDTWRPDHEAYDEV